MKGGSRVVVSSVGLAHLPLLPAVHISWRPESKPSSAGAPCAPVDSLAIGPPPGNWAFCPFLPAAELVASSRSGE